MTEEDLDRELWSLAARWRLGRVDWRDLEAYGLRALLGGRESDSTVELASVNASVTRAAELGALITAALAEAGVQLPSELEAARVVAGDIEAEVLSGERSPYQAAEFLWRLTYDYPATEALFQPFVGLASEYEDAIQSEDVIEWRSDLDKEILGALREIENAGAGG